MATETHGSSSGADGLTAAERLQQQHATDQPHNPTVEEVVDEEYRAHPPPSGLPSVGDEASNEKASSSKAAGKQPVRENASKPALDTQSEELFPALGAPKSKAAAAPSMWSKKPSAVGKAANGLSNGQGAGVPSTNAGAGSGPNRGPVPQMSLPGRYSEQIQLHHSVMTPRKDLKKPVAEILREINKRSKANVEMKSGPGGVIVFEGTGPVDAVRIALKEVANQLCAKQNIKVAIPIGVRGKIVGKQGATIQAISKKTGARINISKQEAADILEDDDLEATIDVSIEGDPFAVQMAKQDIEKIVNEHTSTVNTRLKHIPAEYYPFLSAGNNSALSALSQGRDLKLNVPQYHTWKDQAPPQNPTNRQPAVFAPQAGLPIQISGERQAVAEIKAEIERQVQELQRRITLEQMAIERGRHQFIVGEMGTSLNEFLAETGCSVILPPDNDDSEMLTVVGPPERIEEGLNKIMDLASSMAMASADIARQHANAPRGAQVHARDVTRYLQQRKGIEQLERLHNARIVPDSTGAWQIYARDGKNAMKARSDVMNLISGHPPTRFQAVDVNPFFHEHLRGQAADQIREQHGVHVVVPDDAEEGTIILVYEDNASAPEYEFPRRQPSPQDAQAFQQALRAAQAQLLGLFEGQQTIVTRDLEAPVKFHDKIRRHVDRHHQSQPQGQIPVQVLYGGSSQPSQKRAVAPNLSVRGPEDSADALLQSLLAFIEQEKQDELERGFTLDFPFPQQYANHLIGRKGENINRLREEFDVEIQLNDAKCQIKGPEAKANAAKKYILDMGRKLEDEATHHLNIPAEFHRELIGPQGAQVNRLQDRYGVRVNFPRSRQAADDASVVDDAPQRKNDQQPNEVIVKGPSKGANECRDELLSLFQYIKDNSHVAIVSVNQSQLPSLIGSGGKEMDALRLETGAQIDVPGSRDAASANGRVDIKIKGQKKNVEAAEKLIKQKAAIFENTVQRTLDVDRRHHRHIIGPSGSTLRSIVIKSGGPEDQRLHNRMVRLPKTDTEGNSIRVEGLKEVVDKIIAEIEAIVRDQDSRKEDVVEVKPEKHRLLIGRGGETRRNLEQQFNVSINIPRQTETGPQRSQVRIQGLPADVEKAKAHILEVTKDQDGETIQVPRRFHHGIADNGQFFRRLRSDHKVMVDHNGQRPPPKPSAPAPSRSNGSAMPLITDDPSASAGSHSWESHDMHSSTEEGQIPWVLSGPSPEAVAAARTKLERALEEAANQDTVGFLILPDPRAYRHVIGPGGAEINRIRKQTGTKIQVPRDQGRGEAIEIVGTKSGVDEARDIILEIVQNNA